MPSQTTEILTTRRNELAAINVSYSTWSQLRAWHARTRPLIATNYRTHLDSFDDFIKFQFTATSDRYDREANDRIKKGNEAKAVRVKELLLSHLDAIIELDTIADHSPLDTTESDSLFSEIYSLLEKSNLPKQFVRAIGNDIREAQKSYSGEAYKACVVMLGAALEGAMLGTLQRTDVLAHLVAIGPKCPTAIRKLGTGHPQLADKIGDELSFEDYKVCIHDLIEGTDDLGVDNIQSFRNAIHPWKSIQEPLKYGDFDRARALHYIGSFKKIIEALSTWKP